jgi:YesN/AraC family two-component response regulator
MLASLGYVVIEATDGADAQALSPEVLARVDAVVTDVVMPRTSGPELVASLRRARPDVGVLFVSGYDAAALAGSTDTFLPKPYSTRDLARTLRDVLDRRVERRR